MRALIVLSVMAIIFFGSNVCEAGMSTGPHKVAAATPAASHATSHRRGSGRVHHARGIGGPIAAVGNAIGSTVGGLFR